MAAESRLRRSLARWASSGDPHARERRRDSAGDKGTSIKDAPDRQLVTLQGAVRSVTLRPRGGVPALEAELDDGSAVLTVIFLGRRRITGIAPGRSMRVTGRSGATGDGGRTMYNPRYELLP